MIATVGSHPHQPASVVGRPVVVPRKVKGALLNQNAVRIAPNSTALDKIFLSDLGQSPDFRHYVVTHARGSANQIRIAIGALKEMPVRLPNIIAQRKIAAILSAYDDLIENNTRRIQILEDMARSLYREWFVHFRFPGHENTPMVESALGLIPEGWEFVPLRDLCEFTIGGDWGSEEATDKTPACVSVIRGTDFDDVAHGKNLRIPSRYIRSSSLCTEP